MLKVLVNISPGVIVVAWIAMVFPAQAAAQARRTDRTTVATAVGRGDEVVVTSDGAPLVIGHEVLANLSRGRRLPVIAVENSWVGTFVETAGKRLSGWVPAADLMLARASGKSETNLPRTSADGKTNPTLPRSVTVFRPITPEPNSETVDRNCVPPRQNSYGPGEWDFYFSGHFEPDPNIHVWEPWRHR